MSIFQRWAMRPSVLFLRILLGFIGFGLAIAVCRIFSPELEFIGPLSALWKYCAFSLFVLIFIDALRKHPSTVFECERVLPQSFGLNRPQNVRIALNNKTSREVKFSISDATPQFFESSDFPLEAPIASHTKTIFEYTVIPKRRGQALFEPAYAIASSGFGFWDMIYRLGESQEVKVFPDFSAVSNSFVFGIEQAMRNMGAHIAKRRGDGMEFNQLREFREGDTLKQIDWKATARLSTPISREYQEEKDQNIIFLLDSSRRMRALERNLSYFDYALNALLMTSYIALDKGDAVGVMAFSGEPSWLPPIKGKASVNTLLNHLYDLHTSTQSSDYVTAAEDLMVRHRKRSLVVLLTNLRDEDQNDLIQAVEILSRNHLVMVVGLREQLLQDAESIGRDKEDDLLLYAGLKYFEHGRARLLALLKAKGVSVVDANNKNLHIQLTNEYLRLKRLGRI